MANQTTTNTSGPPSWLQPYYNQALTGAQQQYNQGPAKYYDGQTVIPFSDQTNQGLSMIQNRATNGSPLTGSASGYANDVLQGKYMGQNNQYLNQTFNTAADQVQNRIQSQFAGSGRNIDAGRNIAAQEMGNLATNIYGGAYESERNRQQQVLPMSGQLANQEYADADRLLGVGGLHEDLAGRQAEDAAARWDFNQNAPGVNLDQYLARIQGSPGSTSSTTSPVYRNQGAGALGGALAGYGLGSQYGYGGWGALAGGLLGGYGG
jgi:hypothetical protein